MGAVNLGRPDRIRQVMSAEEFRAKATKKAKRRAADRVIPVNLPAERLDGGRIRIALPIPPMRLSPNRRGHTKARGYSSLVKRFRFLAKQKMEMALAGEVMTFSHYSLAFFYEPRRRRDDDNFDGSVKCYRDGIADALGMNDRKLVKGALSTFEVSRDAPRVEVTLWNDQVELPPNGGSESKKGVVGG